MSKVIINNYDEFAALLGKNIGISDYVQLTQERISQLPTPLSTTSGFTSIPNVPLSRARSRPPSPTATSRSRCFHTSGTR